MDDFQRSKIFESGNTEDPFDETLHIISLLNVDVNVELISRIRKRIVKIFLGKDPDFKASNTEYHNLRHTCMVVLATTRLLHGLSIRHQQFSSTAIEQCIVSAFFHDTGLLLRSHDVTVNGATYTKNHEERSIHFLNKVLGEMGIDENFRDVCASIIHCTNLGLNPEDINFVSEEAKMCGWIVGSADILAQMADRYYLEQLSLLFNEKRIGGVNTTNSVTGLMNQTTEFFEKNVTYRLEVSFHNISQAMEEHFMTRWGIDHDPYKKNMSKNINYLQKILDSCQIEFGCIEKFLRRLPPVSHLNHRQQKN